MSAKSNLGAACYQWVIERDGDGTNRDARPGELYGYAKIDASTHAIFDKIGQLCFEI